MRVFLSWSGPRSASIARALRDWLPTVLQAVEPWMSESDIDKGARWTSEIAGQLEEAQVGIMCLTPDNMSSPWLHFEAGALSKTLQKSRVCTYLLGIEPTDLGWPLAMFQATRATKEETRQLLTTINKALEGAALPPERFDKTFEQWWPDLKHQIDNAPQGETAPKTIRSDRELLEEILELMRNRGMEEQLAFGDSRLARELLVAQDVVKVQRQIKELEVQKAELEARRAAIVEASRNDPDGQVEIGLARGRKELDAVIQRASENLNSLKSVLSELTALRLSVTAST